MERSWSDEAGLQAASLVFKHLSLSLSHSFPLFLSLSLSLSLFHLWKGGLLNGIPRSKKIYKIRNTNEYKNGGGNWPGSFNRHHPMSASIVHERSRFILCNMRRCSLEKQATAAPPYSNARITPPINPINPMAFPPLPSLPPPSLPLSFPTSIPISSQQFRCPDCKVSPFYDHFTWYSIHSYPLPFLSPQWNWCWIHDVLIFIDAFHIC